MSSKPCISEVSHSISVNCQNTNREGSQQTSEAPVHMAFASSARHWELPALLLVWKALGLVWKAALRATAEDRVSLSGCGPGKGGGGVLKPACGFDQIFPHLSWQDGLLFQELFHTPAAGGGGWVTGTGSELGKGGGWWDQRHEEGEKLPLAEGNIFFHETFSAWSPWTCGLVGVNDICSVSDYSCG